MAVPDAVTVIQATLAPAFLLSGTGIVLNFMQTRLFRVVDRSRAHPDDAGRALLLRRARLLRNGIALGVLAFAFTVATAIVLMASQMFASPVAGTAAPMLFSLAMVALFIALGFVLWDTVLSVRSVARAT